LTAATFIIELLPTNSIIGYGFKLALGIFIDGGKIYVIVIRRV
jgi:hypothetical protein